MLTPITPLSGRMQAVLTAIAAMMVTLFASIIIDFVTSRWPMQLGELPWRYQLLMTIIAAGPQLLTLLGFVALIAVFAGNNTWLRAVAVALAAVAILEFIALPLAALDFLQVRRLEPTSRMSSLNAAVLKAMLFGAVSVVIAGWGALRGWQATESEHPNARRQKGDGLIVGQSEPPPAQ